MVSLFLCFDLLFGRWLGGWRRSDLELFKLPQLPVQGFREVFGCLSDICDDIREEFLPMVLIKVSG